MDPTWANAAWSQSARPEPWTHELPTGRRAIGGREPGLSRHLGVSVAISFSPAGGCILGEDGLTDNIRAETHPFIDPHGHTLNQTLSDEHPKPGPELGTLQWVLNRLPGIV